MRPAFAGFVIGALLPEAVGLYLVVYESTYLHYAPPKFFHCGNGLVEGLALVIVIGPVMGAIAAGIAILGTRIPKWIIRLRKYCQDSPSR